MKAIIIEYEGVIIDGKHLVEQKSKQIAAVLKEPWSKEFMDYWKNTFLHLTEGRITLGEYYSKLAEMVGKPVTGAEDTEFMKGEKLRDKDIPAHIAELRRKYGAKTKLGILANYPSRWVEHLLDANNISRNLQAIVCSDKIKTRKPHEEAFNAILEKLQVRANECIYVGHNTHDLEAAKDMGMKVLYLGDLDSHAGQFTTIASLLDIQQHIN